MLNIDLGLSDEEETPARGSRQREESVSDLLSGKDPTLMFSSATSRGSRRFSGGLNIDLSGGGDPLDALKDSMHRQNAPAPEPMMDDEELAFQLEFQRQIGLLGGDDAAAESMTQRLPAASPARRTPSPAIAHSNRDDGSDESLADIVGDILEDANRPAKKASCCKQKRRHHQETFSNISFFFFSVW